MTDLISRLSEIRSDYNCFDENERDAYHTLSEAIKVLSAQPSFSQPHEKDHIAEVSKMDCISRQMAIDTLMEILDRPNHAEFLYTDEICKALGALPSAQPEPCDDPRAVIYYLAEKIGIHRLYELVVALRGEPEQRWIPCSERLPAYGEDVLISIGGYCNVGHIVSVNEEEQYNWYFSGWYHLPNDVDAWMPLPEPRKEGEAE